MNVQPLRTVFEGLTDPLAGRRRSQPWGRTLTMIFLAWVSGETSERGIASWLEEHAWRLKKVFGYRRDDVPGYSTIRKAREEVDGDELESRLAGWAKQVEGAALCS